MSLHPEVDVVVLSWNRAEMTVETIRNVQQQQGVKVSLWVIDQGSSEENLVILRRVISEYNNAQFIEVGRNLGVAGGRNLGMSQGKAPIVVAIDNDAEFASPDALRLVVDRFEHETTLGVVGFRIMNYYTGSDDEMSWVYPKTLKAKRGEVFYATRFVGAGHGIRRQALEKAGGYDEQLFFYWEELDLSNKIINIGYSIVYEPAIVVRHKVSPEARVRWADGRFYFLVRNALYLHYKFHRSLVGLFVMGSGYLVKGAFNRIPGQALKGIVHAGSMCLRAKKNGANPNWVLDSRARSYIWEHELRYRGSFWNRVKNEVIVHLPGGRQA
jgi:GT2 family glycosyltransferase